MQPAGGQQAQADYTAAWQQYYAAQAQQAQQQQAAAAAAAAPAVAAVQPAAATSAASVEAQQAAWAQYYAQQAAWQQHQQVALAGPHADAWRAYYAQQAAGAASQAPASAAVPPAGVAPSFGGPAATEASAPQSYAAVAGRGALHVGTATTVTSYHAVPPPGSASYAAPITSHGLPPPRPPPGPPPPSATASAAPHRPGIAAPYSVATYGAAQGSGSRPPAYITPSGPQVAMVRPPAGSAAATAAETGVRAGWPPQLRAWVERAFMSCGDDATAKAWIKVPMKHIIEEATSTGELWTRNWDATPIPSRHPQGQQQQQPAQVQPRVAVPHASAFTAGGGGGAASAWGAPAQAATQPQPGQQQQQYPAWMQQQQAGQGQAWHAGGAMQWQQQQQQYIAPTQYTTRPSRARSRSRSYSSSGSRSRSDDSRGRHRGRPRVGRTKEDSKRGSKRGAQKAAARQAQAPLASWNAADVRLLQHREGRFGDGRAVGGSHYGGGLTGAQRRRAAAALQLSLAVDGGEGEGPDWDAMTIKGTCTTLEKSYFRLTSAPDPSTVRPAAVLQEALERLRGGAGELKWFYVNDQCKALRQDLTVQRIRTPLTASVYEFHARAALDAGDLAEYNQCATVLAALYDEGVSSPCIPEFAAYRILYAAVAGTHQGAGVASSRALGAAVKSGLAGHAQVAHALRVATSLRESHYAAFFSAYRAASAHAKALMDAAVEAVRFSGVTTMTRAYRPSISLTSLAHVLGFDVDATDGGGDAAGTADGGVGAAKEWLVAHGAVVVAAPDGSLELDCRASGSTLFVPVDENAVAHGDVDLDVTDFMKNF